MPENKEQNRSDICYEVLFGREGHPEDGIVWTVKEIAKQQKDFLTQLKTLKSSGWAMVLLCFGLIIKEILTTLTNAN